MTVADLIAHLQTFDPKLPCVYMQYSDWTELEREHITVERLQPERGDGYVGSLRPDKRGKRYLTFPGN